MADDTKIEWTHRPGTRGATMNALVGCKKISPGCKNCYAKNLAYRFSKVEGSKFFGTAILQNGEPNWTGRINLDEKALLAPLRKKDPRTYFVNSLSDLFEEGVPDEWIDRHFAVFAAAPQHTFIVLTKRAERMKTYLTSERTRVAIAQWWKGNHLQRWSDSNVRWNDEFWPLKNVWLGVSVENQETAKRVWSLLQTPAAVRFASCEPLLGPVDFDEIEALCHTWRRGFTIGTYLDWVIAGGESGRHARPMHPDWARSLRDQCAAAGVPFFFKQWGEWLETDGPRCRAIQQGHGYPSIYLQADGSTIDRGSAYHHAIMSRFGKKLAGDLLDGVQHHAFPEVR